MKKFQQGNTVRTQATFKNFSGELTDPSGIRVTIYEAGTWNVVHRSDELTEANKLSTGVYFYDYVVERTGLFWREWCGTVDGLPSLRRAEWQVDRG